MSDKPLLELEDQINRTDLAPEEKFLWHLMLSASRSVQKGLKSKKKSEIIAAIEDLEWFFLPKRRSRLTPLKCSNFLTVCHALKVNPKAIQAKIASNPNFPTYEALKSRLREVIVNKRS